MALRGQAAVALTSPGVEGLISQLTAADVPTAVAAWDDFRGVYSSRVDGKYSVDGQNVRLVVNANTFRYGYSIQIGTSGDLLFEILPTSRFRVSANMPDTDSTTNIATAISYAAGPRRGFVQPVWRAASVIRDPYTNAAKGQVALTVVLLAGAAMVDSAPYALHAFKLA